MPKVEPDPGHRNTNVIALANDKGGAGKSTICANLADALAAKGHRVLTIDIDLSGALRVAFGIIDHDDNDEGASLVSAVLTGSEPRIVSDIRPGVDWIPGGMQIWNLVVAAIRDQVPIPARFAEMLAPIAAKYDYVLLDCPPSNPPLQEMVLAGTKWLLVPARPDPSNWDGLRRIGPVVRHVRQHYNSELAWLGVVVFGVPATGSRILRVTRAYLDTASATVPVMESTIRYQSTAALGAQLSGRTARELAEARKGETRKVIAALRRGQGGGINPDDRIPASVSHLAEDYNQLADEVLTRISAATSGGAR